MQSITAKPKPSDELTTTQFRVLANCSRSTISRWISEGIIPPEAVRRTETNRFRIKRWALGEVLS